MTVSKRVAILMVVVFLTVLAALGLAHRQVQDMQFDSRVVNHAGIVRGAAQRLVKLELSHQPNDELISRLDKLVIALLDGDDELRLPKAEEEIFIEKMEAVRTAWGDLRAVIIAHRNDSNLAGTLLSKSEAYFGKTNDAVFAAEEASKKKISDFGVGLFAVGVVSSLIIAMVWWTMHSRVARPIRVVSDLLIQISKGDLTVKFDSVGKDEISVLGRAGNVMLEEINRLIVEANESSVSLARLSEQLYISTIQISSSNRNVSSQAESVASAAVEMSATVQEVARNTSQVYISAENARKAADDGTDIISRVVSAIHDIAEVVEKASQTARVLGVESEKIGMVVQVIEDIADQTNLLALNAAIEAARAGESGRGFAVVADEVRKLAEKTVKATQEISRTVESIQTESHRAVSAIAQGMETVSKGRELGEHAGVAIQSIKNQVDVAAEQTSQIASATEELAATALDTAKNVDQISEAVQQTTQSSMGVENVASKVVGKAEELYSITQRFTTV